MMYEICSSQEDEPCAYGLSFPTETPINKRSQTHRPGMGGDFLCVI
ncbi:MAG: hypothetical protein WCO09_01885 [bacterium]